MPNCLKVRLCRREIARLLILPELLELFLNCVLQTIAAVEAAARNSRHRDMLSPRRERFAPEVLSVLIGLCCLNFSCRSVPIGNSNMGAKTHFCGASQRALPSTILLPRAQRLCLPLRKQPGKSCPCQYGKACRLPMQSRWLSSFRFLVRENSARVPAELVAPFALTNLYGSLTDT